MGVPSPFPSRAHAGCTGAARSVSPIPPGPASGSEAGALGAIPDALDPAPVGRAGGGALQVRADGLEQAPTTKAGVPGPR